MSFCDREEEEVLGAGEEFVLADGPGGSWANSEAQLSTAQSA